MSQTITKSPRIYIDIVLKEAQACALPADQSHYLITVMRKQNGDIIRVFNGKDGEFTGTINLLNKKSAELINVRKIKKQPKANDQRIHLYFVPIKKDRLAFMVEKAVELGVTDLHPVLSDHTENRKPNMDKITRYITEAAEQCERMDIPTLHPVTQLAACHFVDPCFAAIERVENIPTLAPYASTCGLLVGPEGGWSEPERSFLAHHSCIHPVSLGDNILRAETAAIYMLSKIR